MVSLKFCHHACSDSIVEDDKKCRWPRTSRTNRGQRPQRPCDHAASDRGAASDAAEVRADVEGVGNTSAGERSECGRCVPSVRKTSDTENDMGKSLEPPSREVLSVCHSMHVRFCARYTGTQDGVRRDKRHTSRTQLRPYTTSGKHSQYGTDVHRGHDYRSGRLVWGSLQFEGPLS